MLKEWRKRQQKEMLKLGYNFISTNNLVFPTWQNKPNQPTQPTQWNNSICEHAILDILRFMDLGILMHPCYLILVHQ